MFGIPAFDWDESEQRWKLDVKLIDIQVYVWRMFAEHDLYEVSIQRGDHRFFHGAGRTTDEITLICEPWSLIVPEKASLPYRGTGAGPSHGRPAQ